MGLQGAEGPTSSRTTTVFVGQIAAKVSHRGPRCVRNQAMSSGSERSYDTFEADRIMEHDDPICTQLVVPGDRILQGYAMMTWEPLQHWFIVPRDVEDGWNINSNNAVSLPRLGLRLGYHP